MNLGELKKIITDLPDDTQIWSWNDRSGYWYRITSFRVGLQHPRDEEAIFISQDQFEDELLESTKDFKVPADQLKKVIIL